jgi:hypothetical protein
MSDLPLNREAIVVVPFVDVHGSEAQSCFRPHPA